ncbi:PucR family transcriptional regulator [Alkalihalophilus sp. As8PL]|uniref:PucR family transcriptional regulator n=1 Tax=Alkalihalophilus sp. As8PL TaxID=3237103 RepID=A0AB39BU92_9BACI
MNLTMDEVTSLPLLKKAIIHTSVDLSAQNVEWVSVIEAPVEQFVRPDEFVLTTGVGLGDNEALLSTFIQDIINAKAAGLAIAKGKFIKEIPKAMIKKAKAENFILLEIDWDVRFSDIIQQSLKMLDQKKRAHYNQIESMQQTLLDFILKGKKIQDVCDHVSNTISAPVFITDNRGSLRGECVRVTPTMKQYFSQALHNRLIETGIISQQHPSLEWFQYGAEHAFMLEIESKDQLQGYLVVGGFGPKPFSEKEHKEWIRLVKHVTTAIALFFLHEQAIKETEWLLRDDFVWEIAKGGTHVNETLQSRAKSLGYRLNLPYVALVATPEYLKLMYDQKKEVDISYDHWLHQQIRQMEEEAEQIAKKHTLKAMITYQNEEFIIFLEVLHDQATETAFRYIQALDERLIFLYPSIRLSWGISKQYGYHLFYESYHEAKKALAIGKKRNGKGSKNLFADTKIDRMIEAMVGVEELTELTRHLLDSLIHYSKERQIDLLHTFMTYHANKGNVSQTARTLNLHRQSLLYRLRKIEALTGCSLDNADDLFLLDLSTRLWTSLEEN